MLTCFATSYQPSRSAFDTVYPTLVDSAAAYRLVAEGDSGIQGYVYASEERVSRSDGADPSGRSLLSGYWIRTDRRIVQVTTD